MDTDPSAPPPSYDDIFGNKQQTNNQAQPPQPGHCTGAPLNFPGHCTGAPLNFPANHHQQPLRQQHPQQNFVQPQINHTQRNVIIVHGTPLQMGPFPIRLICPACNQSTLTRVEQEYSCVTHAMAFFLFFFGLFLCSCLPYCINSLKNSVHYCRKCGQYIGTYQFMQQHNS